MADTAYKFEGWVALDESSIEGKMVWRDYQPKAWEETDVDIKVTHAGMCGSDLHQLRGGWSKPPYPMVVGHEIVGTVVRVGSQANSVSGPLRIGDRVGVGAQGDSCQGRVLNGVDHSGCEPCASSAEQYCPSFTQTYSQKHFNGDYGQGGYALYHRAVGHFVVKIPEGLDSAAAAPMMCGGATAFGPLKYFGGGLKPGGLKGKTVGVVGIGGIGHFAIVFARAMGADKVIALSRRKDKREDALAMGAHEHIATAEDEGWTEKYDRSVDMLLSTSSSSKVNFADWAAIMKRDGTICQIGSPEDGKFEISSGSVIAKRLRFCGAQIGSPSEIAEMLQFAADKKLKFWIEQRPMKDANQAVRDFEAGKVRYRYTLVNDGAEG